MQITHIISLISFSFLLAGGQILFKKTALSAPPLSSIAGVISLSSNLWFWAALVLYGSATLLWIIILQKVPLSLAYPFAALGFVIVPLASLLLFKEPISLSYIAGAACIIAGLFIITLTGSVK